MQYVKSPLYRNSLFLISDTIVTSGLGFFFWMVVARFYTDSEVGWAASIISVISLLALLSKLGFNASLIWFLPKAEKPVDMINSCFSVSGAVALALAAVFVVGLELWSPALGFIGENVIFSLAFACFTLLWTLSGLTEAVFVANRRAEFVLLKAVIFSLFKIPLPIILVLFFHSFAIVASWGVAIGIAMAFSLFLLLPKVQNLYKPAPKLNAGIISQMWRYSTGTYVASLFRAAPGLVLPIMVVNLLGAQYNAYFYVAWMIAGLLFAIPWAISQSLFAEGSHFGDKLGVNVRQSLKFTFLLLAPAIVLLFLLGKWLLLLFGEGYSAEGLTLLWILGISSVFVGINSVYNTVLRVEGRIRELAIISGFIASVVLPGSYFIMTATGMVGIGYTWLIAQGIISAYALYSMRSYYRVGEA